MDSQITKAMQNEIKLTITGDGIVGGGREGPLGVGEDGRSEEVLDRFIGGARIAEPMQPQYEGTGHGVGLDRKLALVIEENEGKGDSESECEERK